MIAIIGAMEREIEKLEEKLEDPVREKGTLRDVLRGRLSGKEVLIVQGGIGKVNMALCTQYLIDRYAPEVIINTGIAGSLAPELDRGDVVIGTDAVEHDMDTTPFGDPRGYLDGIDGVSIPLDKQMADMAEMTNREVNPDIHTFRGRIASGDQFVATAEGRDSIYQEFGALCCEMEGAAMAHVAYMNHVPALVIRSISDKADGSTLGTYEEFKTKAIERTTVLLTELMKRL